MSSRPHSSRGGGDAGNADVFVDRDRSSPAHPQAKHAPPPSREHASLSYGSSAAQHASAAASQAQAQAWAPQHPAASAASYGYHPADPAWASQHAASSASADDAARRAFEQHMQRVYQQQQPPFYPPPPFSPQQHHAAAAAAASAAGYPAPASSQMLPPPPTPLSFDPLRMQQWMQHSQHAAAAGGAGMMPGAVPAWHGGGMPLPLPLPLPLPPHPSDPFASYAAHPNAAAPLPPSFDVEAELLFLSKIERKARSLQSKGHHLMAVELLEQSVASRKMLYGELSDEVRVAAEQLSLVYNSLAMASLYKEEYKVALRLLRKAELLTTHMSELTSVRVQTLNNLACCYRRLARPKTALNLLRESLVLLGTEKGTEGRPVTHLNMCAILSQLGRHDEAIEHAKAAVMHCQKQLLTHPQPSASSADHTQHNEGSESSDSPSNSDDGDDSHSDSSAGRRSSSRARRSRRASSSAAALSLSHQQLSEKIVILSIAYHNLGVEEEFLLRFDRALHWYAKALQLALEQIGEGEEITATFKRSLVAAKKQVQERHRIQQKAEAVSKAASAAASEQAGTARWSGSASSTAREKPRAHSRPASATSARSASASRAASRPTSAASSRAPPAPAPAPQHQQYASSGRARPSSAHHSSRAPASHSNGGAAVPSYASATNGSSARVRPKSASVSRPPRPGR